MLSLYVGPISLYILWDCGMHVSNVQTNVIALGGAHIAFHGLATRVHCSTGFKKHNFGGRSYEETGGLFSFFRGEALHPNPILCSS